MKEMFNATVRGDQVDSGELTFVPGLYRHRELSADSGTAGCVHSAQRSARLWLSETLSKRDYVDHPDFSPLFDIWVCSYPSETKVRLAISARTT